MAFPLALASVFAVHTALVIYFFPPGLILSSTRLAGTDFEFHAVEIDRVDRALAGWGHSWAWDPQLLAGYPEGTVFDCDSRAWELFVHGLHRAGVPPGLAFNLFVLLMHLCLPPVVYFSARLFDQPRWTALAATSMAILLWHFDSTVHLTWRLGTISYAASGYGSLLPLASFSAFLRSQRTRHLALLCVSLSLAHLLHPFVFDALVLPMGVMYVQAAQGRGWKVHAGAALAVVVTLAVNSWWLVVLLGFREDIIAIQTPWQGTLAHLFIDLRGEPGGDHMGAWWGVRTGFAILTVTLAAMGLVRWRVKQDTRFAPLAVGISVLVAAAYLGEFVPGLEQTQSYRHIIPALMLCVIPAASALTEGVREWWEMQGRVLVRHLGIALGLVVVLLVAHEILFFFPRTGNHQGETGEDHVVRGHEGECLFTPPRAGRFRHSPLPRDFHLIEEEVADLDPSRGRILVESWDLAEHLAWSTPAQVMGGFPFRNVRHSLANPANRMAWSGFGVTEFERYLTDYAVRWVIFSRPHPDLVSILERKATIRGVPGGSSCTYELFGTRVDVSFFAENHGEVTASLNTIGVKHTDPSRDVVLRYHYMGQFLCEPGCALVQEPVLGDPVGFIRIPAPHPESFTLVNGY